MHEKAKLESLCLDRMNRAFGIPCTEFRHCLLGQTESKLPRQHVIRDVIAEFAVPFMYSERAEHRFMDSIQSLQLMRH